MRVSDERLREILKHGVSPTRDESIAIARELRELRGKDKNRPRRRYRLVADMQADTLKDLLNHLQHLEFELSSKDGVMNSVMGGPSSGWIVEATVDESVTHESYMEAIQPYLSKNKESTP